MRMRSASIPIPNGESSSSGISGSALSDVRFFKLAGGGEVRYWFTVDPQLHHGAYFRSDLDGYEFGAEIARETFDLLYMRFPRVIDIVLLNTTGLPNAMMKGPNDDKPHPRPMREPGVDTDAIRAEVLTILRFLAEPLVAP